MKSLRKCLFIVAIFIGALATGLPAAGAATAGDVFDMEWGSTGTRGGPVMRPPGGGIGSGNGLFTEALDLDVDYAGNVYVLDMQGNWVQRFDGEGGFATRWPVVGPGLLLSRALPYGGISTDTAGDVYVSSTTHNAVLVFDGAGHLKRGNESNPGHT